VPYTRGNVMLPAAKIDCAVHVSRAPVEVPPPKIGETEQKIAEIVTSFIDDGSILQLGVGAMPEAILKLLSDRRDLGFHSGMLSDSVVALQEAGVITNATKPFDRGVSVTTALIGTERLYRFAHRNPSISVSSSSYVHSPQVLPQLTKFITINTALEVDLTGQVNAEQGGSRYVGGTGGQADFVRAGARSKGGHAFIALPSTTHGAKASRITAHLTGPVTTPRTDVDIIVTEFGAAELKGQTLAERTRRLIEIAHPNFREELARTAHTIQQRGY